MQEQEARLAYHGSYLDQFGRHHDVWLEPVRVATTAAITLATGLEEGDTIDGLALVNQDRVLVKDQADASENGIYIVATSGAPRRSADMLEGYNTTGQMVLVQVGTVNAGTVWRSDGEQGHPAGTPLTWVQWATGVTDHGALGGLGDDDHSAYVKVVGGGVEGFQSHGAMGSTETIDLANGNSHAGTLSADCTFTFTGATASKECEFVLELLEDGTGGWQPTWPGSVVWPGGSAPTHDDTAGSVTIYVFRSRDGGTTWYGFQAGAGGGGGSVSYATPAIGLGNAAAAGAASTVIRSDSTIEAFDDNPPTTIDYDDAPAAGAADFAARSDHRHGAPSQATGDAPYIWRPLVDGDGELVISGDGEAIMAFGPA